MAHEWQSTTSVFDDEFGIAPSSVFSSTSARSMPWETKKARDDPGPLAYNLSGRKSVSNELHRHSAKSAAFASTSDRFAKTRQAAPDSIGVAHSAMGASTSGGLLVLLPAVPCSCPETPGGPSAFHTPIEVRFAYSSPITTVTFSPALLVANKQTTQTGRQQARTTSIRDN